MNDQNDTMPGNSGLTPAARRALDRRALDRYWLLTWTTYGTWLPGDRRGFVSNIDRGDGRGQWRNGPGTKPAANIPRLQDYAQNMRKGGPVYLNEQQATAVAEQFFETATFRGWQLEAAAIMRNHIHIVVGVIGDPEPETFLRDFKSYASRKLNRTWPGPTSGTWWTESGSRRKLPHEQALAAAVAYVRDQGFPLYVWIDPHWEAALGPRRAPMNAQSASGGRKSPIDNVSTSTDSIEN